MCRPILVAFLAWAALLATVPAAADMTPTTPVVKAGVDADIEAGKAAIARKDWAAAIASFEQVAARQSKNADVENYLGYAYRNSGDFDKAFAHYRKALEIDPKHRGAHEYIGEAYLLVGNLPKAQEHLAALDKLCFLPCEEYSDLKKKIAAHPKR